MGVLGKTRNESGLDGIHSDVLKIEMKNVPATKRIAAALWGNGQRHAK